MPVAEQRSSSEQPREAKQYLKDLSQNLSGLALSALAPLLALTPPSLLAALGELWQVALSGAAPQDPEVTVQVPPQQARVGDAEVLLAQGEEYPTIHPAPFNGLAERGGGVGELS